MSGKVTTSDVTTDVETIAGKIADERIDKASRVIKEDFLIIFGIFATLLIFLSIEIQVLQRATRFSLLIGFSTFLLGSTLAFLLGLNHIVKEKNKLADYNNPLVYFILSCFAASIICFAWASF